MHSLMVLRVIWFIYLLVNSKVKWLILEKQRKPGGKSLPCLNSLCCMKECRGLRMYSWNGGNGCRIKFLSTFHFYFLCLLNFTISCAPGDWSTDVECAEKQSKTQKYVICCPQEVRCECLIHRKWSFVSTWQNFQFSLRFLAMFQCCRAYKHTVCVVS